LVSHDRDFMDNVVTGTLAFEGHGQVREYVGGYQDWIRQGGKFDFSEQPVATVNTTVSDATVIDAQATALAPLVSTMQKKLSYKEKRELEELPKLIEGLEAEQEQLREEASSAGFYQQDHQLTSTHVEKMAAVNEKLETCFERWVELSDE
jgi:ATP-binding cassette subfamily F protein uup